ncbi:flagellar export chaperone FliS [Desulfocurvus vexinensis]|uniref:flagellar export chaperone FliS n=1 Tax=Desulfocurvus vexinensis TaxID=399548 RepID=UPI0004B52ABF|nr:flagellar export chaperone FliS [Desulfocurvus vexinensis]
MLKAAKAYFQTQVTTTTQGDLLILLYDGAIKYLNQAKICMAQRDYAGKGQLISRAMDVISELDECLNREKGGELAMNLHQLYFYCNTRLLRANLEMKPEKIDEVVRILDSLRDAFNRIKSTAPQQQAAEAQEQPPAPAQAPQAAPEPPAQPAPQAQGTYGPRAVLRPVHKGAMPGTYGPSRQG